MSAKSEDRMPQCGSYSKFAAFLLPFFLRMPLYMLPMSPIAPRPPLTKAHPAPTPDNSRVLNLDLGFVRNNGINETAKMTVPDASINFACSLFPLSQPSLYCGPGDRNFLNAAFTLSPYGIRAYAFMLIAYVLLSLTPSSFAIEDFSAFIIIA